MEPGSPGDAYRMKKTVGMLALCGALLTACGPDYEAVSNFGSGGSKIICFGDSITRGYGATPGHDYPSELGRLLGREVVNAGVDGDTTAEALRRLKRDVLDRDPWIVIIELSGNDLLSKVPEAETRRNLDEIVRQCTAAGAMVVLVHCKFGLFLSDPYLETHETLAEQHGTLLVKHALKGILGTPSRMSDQIHPNDEGYSMIASRVHETVAPLISRAESRRGR